MKKQHKIVFDKTSELLTIHYHTFKDKINDLINDMENSTNGICFLGNIENSETYLDSSKNTKNSLLHSGSLLVCHKIDIERAIPDNEESVISKITFTVEIEDEPHAGIFNSLFGMMLSDDPNFDINQIAILRPCGYGRDNYNGTYTYVGISCFDLIVFPSKSEKDQYLGRRKQVELIKSYR